MFFFRCSFAESKKIKQIGITYGVFNTNLSEITKALNSEFNDLTFNVDFKKNNIVNRYSIIPTLGITVCTAPFLKNRIFVDLSMKYYFLKKQMVQTEFYERGLLEPVESNGIFLLFGSEERENYDYGFRFNLFSFSALPYFSILSSKKIEMNLGVGLIFTNGFLEQLGAKLEMLEESYIASEEKEYSSDWSFGFIPSFNFGYKLNRLIPYYKVEYAIQKALNTYQAQHILENNELKTQYHLPLIKNNETTPRFNLKGFHHNIGISFIL